MAEQCIYSKAQLPVSSMTFDTRHFHLKFKDKVCVWGGLLLLNLTVCHSFKLNEEKNTHTKLTVNETVEQCLRAASCQI